MKRMNAAEAAGIPACFKDAVDDPRDAGGRRCRIDSLPALCAAATLCGATGWKSIREWIRSPSPAMPNRFRRREVDGARQRPGICCIRNIMIRVDPDQPAGAWHPLRLGICAEQWRISLSTQFAQSKPPMWRIGLSLEVFWLICKRRLVQK